MFFCESRLLLIIFHCCCSERLMLLPPSVCSRARALGHACSRKRVGRAYQPRRLAAHLSFCLIAQCLFCHAPHLIVSSSPLSLHASSSSLLKVPRVQYRPHDRRLCRTARQHQVPPRWSHAIPHRAGGKRSGRLCDKHSP